MTEKRLTKEQNASVQNFETERSGSKGSKKKARRVSQRRELVVVTLGAVAAITGLGGVLSANPPGWAASSDSTAPETSAAEPSPADSTPTSQAPALVQDNPSARPVQLQAPVQEAPPAYSPQSQASAATKSRGS
jgi:hypothetical protein